MNGYSVKEGNTQGDLCKIETNVMKHVAFADDFNSN